MGLLLPLGDEGTLGAGIGIAPRVSGKSSLTAPTTIISSDTILNIGGLQVSLLITAADIQENMMIFLPEDRTLLSGDVIGGNFPYIATARFEPDRNPQDFIEALNKSLDLNPQNIVPGHGRILLGEEDVKDVLESNKDVIQFMIDQVNRAIINGLSPDEIIDQLKLPKKIAKHPDLQPHYHKIDWIIRQMFLKNAGFFGSEMDLAKLTKKQESIRMSEMLGGEKVMLNQAELAFAKKDYRWAASLSDRLLSISKDNKEAIDLR
jgi:alkyl sulfatase BDS1-like metallo-beta-lactamase superfamily hydrolase